MKSHLHDTVIPLGGTHHDVALLDAVAQWFLAIDILPRLASGYHLQAVPVVGRTHDHDINILVVNKFTPIFIEVFHLFPGDLGGIGSSLIQYVFIAVGQGHTFHLRIAEESFQVFKPHAIAADQTNANLVVGCDFMYTFPLRWAIAFG